MITPANDYLLVEPIEVVTQSKSGLVISGNKNTETIKGKDQDGRIIFFDKYSGREITYEGKLYYALKEEDVLATETSSQ